QRQLFSALADLFRVLDRFADAHVQDDLVQTRDHHVVLVAELFLERGPDPFTIFGLEARSVFRGVQHQITSPVVLAKRTFWSPSMRKPTRVGLPFLSSSARFDRWIGMFLGTRPPGLVCDWRVWRSATFTPSTTALSSLGMTCRICPCLPLSLPVSTTTVSPFF